MKATPITFSLARKWIPPRPENAHKGSFGRLFILAGSRGMAGAAILCATGAMRSGAGLVRLGIVKGQQSVAAKRGLLEVMTEALPEDREGRLGRGALREILKAIRKFQPDILVVGPGLGETKEVGRVVHGLLTKTTIPMVLDADGLNVIAKLGKGLKRSQGPLIVTPHPGELGRLMKKSPRLIQETRVSAAVRFARIWDCVCVLKGAGTIVSDGAQVLKNTTGNPGMAKGGTGDVLAGVIGGLWGQMSGEKSLNALRAAALGVFLHGLAGDLAAKKRTTRAMLASELAGFIPQAFKKL